MLLLATSACKPQTQTNEVSLVPAAATPTYFASGTKAVVIKTKLTTAGGSFVSPGIVPTTTTIPSTHPGYDGATTYLPGVPATTFYSLDGTTITQPDWLLGVELGVTALAGAATSCATFGGAGSLDVQDTYRVSEKNCGAGQNGTGTKDDAVFARILIDRTTSNIGAAENLMVQVEYQASGLYFNSQDNTANVEDNVDQTWKAFWGSTLPSTLNPFAIFVPPNYSACDPTNTAANICVNVGYSGAQIRTRQMIFPLAAYSDVQVIQFSRIKQNNTATITANCADDSPLCVGVVIHSITLMRI